MARAGWLHARAAAWYATAPAAYLRRWDEHLHRAAFRYYLYDNTVAGERYLALDALTLSPALHARLVAATETLARVFQRAVHAVRRERAGRAPGFQLGGGRDARPRACGALAVAHRALRLPARSHR